VTVRDVWILTFPAGYRVGAMRVAFVAYLTVIAAGLVVAFVVGLGHH
jgi:hypothetical protein